MPTKTATVLKLADKVKPDWTPEQVISEFLKEIRSGESKPVKIMCHYYERDAKGLLIPHCWYAGMGALDAIALAACTLDQMVREAKEPQE